MPEQRPEQDALVTIRLVRAFRGHAAGETARKRPEVAAAWIAAGAAVAAPAEPAAPPKPTPPRRPARGGGKP